MAKSNKSFMLSCERAEKALRYMGIGYTKERLKNNLGYQLRIIEKGFAGIFVNAYDSGKLYTQGKDDGMMLFLVNGLLKLRSECILKRFSEV